MSLSDALTMVGYSAECVKMDYKSVIVRTKSNELTDLTGSIVALILRPSKSYSSSLVQLLGLELRATD